MLENPPPPLFFQKKILILSIWYTCIRHYVNQKVPSKCTCTSKNVCSNEPDFCWYSYQSKSAKTVLDTILEIQPKDSSGGGSGETRESIVYRICDDMLEKLPNDYVPFEVKARLEKMGRLQPMNIFLKQEIDRMQKVISTVRSTLQDLKLAIDGTIIMSESLRDALDCMYDARIPKIWQKVSTILLINKYMYLFQNSLHTCFHPKF